VSSGGALTNGIASSDSIISISGGIEGDGTAQITSYVNEPVNGSIQGGADLAGSAIVTQPIRHFYPNGNYVVVSGATTYKSIGFFSNYDGSGSVVTGGSSRSVYGFISQSSGQITIAGSSVVSYVTYKFIPKGKATTGGSAQVRSNDNAHGGSLCSGVAEINRYYFRFEGSGDVTVGSANVIKMSYHKAGKGRVIVRGEAQAKKSHHEYESILDVVVNGKTVIVFVGNYDCPSNSPCPITRTSAKEECPAFDFFYSDPKFNRAKGSGAYLPAITQCSQGVSTRRRRPRKTT
jgi:hypothetical protein